MKNTASASRLRLGAGVLCALYLASCDANSPTDGDADRPPPGPPALIFLSPAALDLLEGHDGQFTARVLDKYFRTLSSPVEWSSSNAAVATVDAGGMVTAVSIGSAMITAQAGAAKATATVGVTSPNDIELAFTEIDVEVVGGIYIATANLALYRATGVVRLELGRAGSAFTTPAWSPDGNRVAYTLVRGALGDSLGEPGFGLVPFEAGSDLYVASLTAAVAPRQLTSDGWSRYPDWSSDGRSIVFVSGRPGENRLRLLDIDKSESTQLGPEGNYRTPRWAPDGQRIAFAATVEGQDDIFIMNRDGSGITNLTSHQAGDASPTWSPDGKRIAFISTRNNLLGDLFVLDLESEVVHRVTPQGGFVSYSQPAWSPAGNEIAFTHITPSGMGISAIRPDGTGLRSLTATVTGYPDYFPAWRRRAGQ